MASQYQFGGVTTGREGGDQGAGMTLAAGAKVCPRCGSRLFDDMDVCYGCLYDFRHPGEGFVALPDPSNVVMREAHVAREGTPPGQGAGAAPLDDMPSDARPLAGHDMWPSGEGAGRGISGRARAVADSSTAGHGGGDGMPASSLMAGDPEATLVGSNGESCQVLVRVATPSLVVTLPVGSDGISLGRNPANDVVLPSRSVSREHLRLLVRSGELMAFDQGATNPATLNGEPIEGGVRVEVGDVIEIGDVHVRRVGA